MKRFLFLALFLLKTIFSFSQEWEDLNDQLFSLYAKGYYEQAIPAGEKALLTAERKFGKDHPNYAISLYNLARVYTSAGNFVKAEPLYVASLALYKRTVGENDTDYISCLNSLALLYASTGEYDKAEILQLEAVQKYKRLSGDFSADYALGLNNLAVLYYKMGDYQKAGPLLQTALKMKEKLLGKNDAEYATSINNMAVLYEKMGTFSIAESMYKEALNIREKKLGKTHPLYAETLNNLGVLYEITGEYVKAEAYYTEAAHIRKMILGEEHPEYAVSVNSLAGLYRKLGHYSKSEELYEIVIKIRKKTVGENHPAYASSLNNIGLLYKNLKDYNKAELFYNKAIVIYDNKYGEEYQTDYIACLNNLATLYQKTQQFSYSDSLLKKVLAFYKRKFGEEHPDYATALNNLAALEESTGKYHKAEKLYNQVLLIRKKILGEQHPDYAISLNNLGVFYSLTGKAAAAEELLKESRMINLKNVLHQFSVLSAKEKESLINKYTWENEILFSFLYKKQTSPAFQKFIFNQALIQKGMLLFETNEIIQTVETNSDTTLVRTYSDWKTTQAMLERQYALPQNKRSKLLADWEAEAEVLEKSLNKHSETFRSKQTALQVNYKDIQNKLQKDEAAIEFIHFNFYNNKWTDTTVYAAFILRKTDTVPVFVSLFEEQELQMIFDKTGGAIQSIAKGIYRGSEEETSSIHTGTELYHLIWEPLMPYLKGIRKISYALSGKLHGIAFHALPVKDSVLLMDHYLLKQYTSTRQIALREKNVTSAKPSQIVLFGNPDFSFNYDSVKSKNSINQSISSADAAVEKQRGTISKPVWKQLAGTSAEVNNIAASFKSKQAEVQIFSEENASEHNLKVMSSRSPQIIHIATHGFFITTSLAEKNDVGFGNEKEYQLKNDPMMRTGIVLAAANYAWSGQPSMSNAEDGIVTAYEISHLNLSKTGLVVLSACETGLGEIKGDEGVFGLQRAFKLAGVQKVLISLWQVPDKETAELMSDFYANWLKGESLENALASAQKNMRKKYSPFYWAGFVLVE
ncbi:MAG: CHAT domain-containing protein [Lacibacter sp.]